MLVTGVCLVVAFWGIDLGEVRESFAQADYWTLPLFLALILAYFWLKAIRWKLLLQPLGKFRTSEVVPAMMIGFMGNNVLPAHLGELVRVYVFARQKNLSKTAVFTSLVLERVFDLLAILTFLGISLVLVKDLPDYFRTMGLWVAGFVSAAIAALAVYIFWTQRFVRVVEWWLDRVPLLSPRLKLKLTEVMEAGATGLASMRSPKLLAGIVALSAAHWALAAGFVYLSLQSFGITEPPLLASFVVVAAVTVAVSVPALPGFFGVVQFAFIMSLDPFGVSKLDAVVASVYYQIVQYIPVTAIGLYYLNRLGLKLGEVEQQATRQEERGAECTG